MKNKGLLQLGVTNVTEKTPMPPYLLRRDATYAYRRVVPVALRPYLLTKSGKPRVEFVISLKTKDLNEAKRLALREAVRVDEEIEAAERLLRNGVPPRRADSRGPVETPYEAARRIHDEESQRWFSDCENETDAEDEQLQADFNRPESKLSPRDRIIRRHLSPALFESVESIAKRTQAYEEAGRAFSERVKTA